MLNADNAMLVAKSRKHFLHKSYIVDEFGRNYTKMTIETNANRDTMVRIDKGYTQRLGKVRGEGQVDVIHRLHEGRKIWKGDVEKVVEGENIV